MTPPIINFLDPYEGFPREEASKLQTYIPADERMFLMSIRPMVGTITTTINLLLKGLINECKRRGITDYSKISEFESLVCERSAISESPIPVESGRDETHDGGGVKDSNPPSPGGKNLDTNTSSRSRTGKAGKASGKGTKSGSKYV